MTPLEKYYADVQTSTIQEDPAQILAMTHLERIYQDMERVANKKIWQFGKEQIKGLYFWGGVGRGKTYMMDLFFESLSTSNKIRLHFHRFMQMVHKNLTEFSGEKNPLEKIAKKLAKDYKIICLDEFFVKDITDAMILGNLCEALFDNKVVLVTTSNIPPDELYKDGLQRQKFLPAIEALKQNTYVLEIVSDTDYRMRTLREAKLYYYPDNGKNREELNKAFNNLASLSECHSSVEENSVIVVQNRKLPFIRKTCMQIWFDFEVLCTSPRSQNDYIELASEFPIIFLENVPQLNVNKDDETRRFINLVDEFYDRGVKLFILSSVGIEEIYAGGILEFEIERTKSRLQEMQSQEYLEREHLV